MDDKKNIKKFEDDGIEILSMEDLEADKAAPKSKSIKRKRNAWQKVILGVSVTLGVILIIGAVTFLTLRTVGEKSLKAEAEAGEDIILYNGKEYQYRKDVINILCLGIDKSEAMEKKIESRDILGMCDAILLVSIDTKENAFKIIAIPRNVMTNVTVTSETGEVQGKKEMELCYQYGYGKRAEQSGQLTVDAVSELLYGVPIEKYCAINFEALPVLNDAIGGVDVVVEEELSTYKPEFVEGAKLHLEGKMALEFVRIRNRTDVEGVVKRTQRQKQYAIAFLQKAKSVVKEDMSLPVTIFQSLQENMSTNVSIADITYLVPELLEMSISEDVVEVLPGESKEGEEFLEFYADKTKMRELVIDTFYEEIEK